MVDRLESFNRSLQQEIRSRRAQETSKQQQIQEMILKLEAEMLAESKVRRVLDRMP